VVEAKADAPSATDLRAVVGEKVTLHLVEAAVGAGLREFDEEAIRPLTKAS
jgi:hypothetical protein